MIICMYCKGEAYIDDEPCVECEAGWIVDDGPDSYKNEESLEKQGDYRIIYT